MKLNWITLAFFAVGAAASIVAWIYADPELSTQLVGIVVALIGGGALAFTKPLTERKPAFPDQTQESLVDPDEWPPAGRIVTPDNMVRLSEVYGSDIIKDIAENSTPSTPPPPGSES